MFYSFTDHHYIAPLHRCLMAKVCNHTGIQICGLEKDKQNMRLFLDDCDMFEYNCDYKKGYSKVDDSFCTEKTIESKTENSTISASAVEDSTSINYSSQTTTDDKDKTSNATRQHTTTTIQTQPESKITIIPTESITTAVQSKSKMITIPTESMTSISDIKTAKCTCMDLQTKLAFTNETTINAIQSKHECPCIHSHSEASSMRTGIDNTTKLTSNASKTTSVERISESSNIMESIKTQAQPESEIVSKTTESLTTQIEADSKIITIPTESMTPVSDIADAKCTCMDIQTKPVPTNESTINAIQSNHECPCMHSHSEPSSMRTGIDNTTEITSNAFETAVPRTTESPNVTESIIDSINVSRSPIAIACTRGKHNGTSISVSEKQNNETITKSSEISTLFTDTVISAITKKRCTCMDTEIASHSSDLVTHGSTTPIFITEESTTLRITETTLTQSESISTLSEKSCTCNSVSPEINETTQTQPKSEIITTPAKVTTLVSRTSANPISTNKSIITLPHSKECTCTNSHFESSSLTTIKDKTTSTTTLNKDDSSEMTLTTVEYYEEVETTPKHDLCDKYPHHCKRPQTWETTARGETRDFFQILRERFGDRVKILKDTTHWPRRMTKPIDIENDNFHFGIHNET